MPKTSLNQKIALVLFGILITIIALELVLRLGGFLFHARQEMGNKASFSSEEIRILCIGESTTALGNDNSYPAQLEDFLNQRAGTKRFKVINKGEISKTSFDLLSHLDENLARYRPHIVVGMIGINDTKDTPGFAAGGAEAFWSKFRVYHLFVLLSQHFERSMAERRMKTGLGEEATPEKGNSLLDPVASSRLDERDYPKFVKNLQDIEKVLAGLSAKMRVPGVSPSERAQFGGQMMLLQAEAARIYKLLGIYHGMREDYAEADKALTMSFRLQPKDPGTLLEVGRLLRVRGRVQEALPVLKAAADVAPQDPQKPLILLELARLYSDMERLEEARQTFLQVAVFGVNNAWLYVEIGNWFFEHGFWEDAEKALFAAYQINGQDHVTIETLAQVEEKLGRAEKAALLHKEADFLRAKMSRYAPETVRNYNEIVRRVQAAGAQMVVMQYPVRPLEPLRSIFQDASRMIFVENRDNFLGALKEGSFTKYFADNFGGDFGHCTSAGNRLIAENIAGVIWTKMFAGR